MLNLSSCININDLSKENEKYPNITKLNLSQNYIFDEGFNNISNIFPNLKSLTLTSWTSEKLLLFIINITQEMKYLEKLVIQELSCSLSIRDGDFIETIFNIKNN